jgi:holliday junction DNA helicase RuvA
VIAAVSGEVLVRRPDHVVIDAGGVGYRLAVSAETVRAVPAAGKKATLHAHLIARDDSLALYGFATESERDLFLALTSVSGVGPKVALAALSGGPVRELLVAIAAGDSKRFQAVPGIGKRTAERIIVELRERIAGELEHDAGEPAATGSEGATPRAEAREGLLGLGYTPLEAARLLDRAAGESAEDLIASALRAGSGESVAAGSSR